MSNIIQGLADMVGMTERVIASDFLISSKSAVRNLAFAITETATPELRAALREELKTAVETHARITDYMVASGYYHPHHLGEDINVRLQDVDTVLNLK